MLLNPYAMIGGGVVAMAIAGSLFVQSEMIHSWHVKYDCVESGLNCPKGAANIPDLKAEIVSMTKAQNTQTGKTEGNVIRVVQGPKEVDTIIKEINSTTSKPCTAPVDTDEVKNAF